jgi:hypothetical protein
VSAGFTPGPWIAGVVGAGGNVEHQSYAHQVRIGRHDYTVGFSRATRRTKSTKLPDGYTRTEAVEDFPPTPSPCADARLIASAPEMHQALLEARLALETIARRVFNDNGDHTINTEPLDPDVYSACYYAARTVADALAKARGETL